MEHLSSSQINLYLLCSLKYKFQYVDLLPRPFKSSNLAFGSVIHSTLSWLHRERMNGNHIPLERVYKIFEADWYSQKTDTTIRYKDGDGEMKLLVLGKEILGLYFQCPHNGIKGEEVPFTVPLVNPATGDRLDVNMEGIIDLIEQDDTIVEFKTSAQSINPKDINDHLQLTVYSYAYELLYQKPPKQLKLVNFVKTKKPKLNVVPTQRNRTDYIRLFNLAHSVLKGIRSNVFFPRGGYWCDGCEYEQNCNDWKGNCPF